MEAEQIGLRQIDCPVCGWSKNGNQHKHAYLRYMSPKTGWHIRKSQLCICNVYEKFKSRWFQMVPPEYRWIELLKLTPSSRSRLSLRTQDKYIKIMQAKPDHSYLFCGPAGVGKSVYAYALLQEALFQWSWDSFDKQTGSEAVWCLSAARLLDEGNAYAKRDMESETLPREPTVNERKIKYAAKQGMKPFLLLTELDKVPNLTANRLAILTNISNSLYENGGSMVADTNLSMPGLIELLGPQCGEPFARRFLGNQGEGRIIDLFQHKLTPFQVAGRKPISGLQKQRLEATS